MSTLKTGLYELIEYTRKMIPQIRELVNDLFGAIPPKIDIIFGPPSTLIPQLAIETTAESLYGVQYFGDGCLGKYPFILHTLPIFLRFWGELRKSLGIQVNPAHYSVVSLSEEYSHYVFDWMHNFKKVEEEHQLMKLITNKDENRLKRNEGLVKLCIIHGRWEAVGEIAERHVIKTLGYSDDFERLSLLKKMMRKMKQKGNLWDRMFTMTHTLGEYYVDAVPKSKKEFQKYIRKNPLIITKKDVIEAETIIGTELGVAFE